MADPDTRVDRSTDRPARAGSGRVSRRSLLGALGSGAVIAVGGTAPTPARAATEYWTLVALPDTQFYSAFESLSEYARDQTEWVVENRDSENIRFVTHEGDLVDDGSDTAEWDRIDEAMSTLDGQVPYSAPPGNHDWAETNDKSSSIRNYTDYFGPSRFDGRSWYGGSGPTSDGLNSYQLFSAGGYDFLHLALEWEPSGTVSDASTPLGWARSVLDDHPDRATILTTHSYLRDDGRRSSTSYDASGSGNSGEVVWEELVEPNAQIFLVLNGHWSVDDGEYHQVSSNADGRDVYEIVANYQDRSNGGNGWMRLLEFRPGDGDDAPDRIRVRSYSPSLDEYETDGDSAFAFDLDFDSRFDPCLSVPEAISGDDDKIDNQEISEAKDYWREVEEVPGTCGETISNEQISYLKDVWRTEGTV